jgi:hypothetical protein
MSCNWEPRLASGLFLFLITSWLSSHTGFRVHGADQIRVPSWSNTYLLAISAATPLQPASAKAIEAPDDPLQERAVEDAHLVEKQAARAV